jgi:aminoglycoside phosphotransferase (APT) family kinase protein
MQDQIFASNLNENEAAKIIRTHPAYAGLEKQVGTLLKINHLSGFTYLAITSNGDFIFRFPPNIDRYELLKKEEKIQKGLSGRINLRIPDTQVYDQAYGCPVFAVHKKIPGEPLQTDLYDRLSAGARYRLITDLANFFNQTHRIPLSTACEWLDMQSWGESTAEVLAPIYGKLEWFDSKTATLIGLALSNVLENEQINLFNETVEAFEGLDTDAHDLVFGHGDLHGYNMAIEQDEFGPKLTGVFDFGGAGILDVHEDFFRLGLISEDLLERVVYIYQNFSNQKRILNRRRLAIYYRAFLFYLMAEQVDKDLRPLLDLLSKHINYYAASYGELREEWNM